MDSSALQRTAHAQDGLKVNLAAANCARSSDIGFPAGRVVRNPEEMLSAPIARDWVKYNAMLRARCEISVRSQRPLPHAEWD